MGQTDATFAFVIAIFAKYGMCQEIWTPSCDDESCGEAYLFQRRNIDCSNPADCIRSITCERPVCPVDGGWTEWSAWVNICTGTCGEKLMPAKRYRACYNPEPRYNGTYCAGEHVSVTNKTCARNPCPVDGGWGEWAPWSEPRTCSGTCGPKYLILRRTRVCDNPTPGVDGKPCPGKNDSATPRTCSDTLCPIDGNFTEWTQWTVPSCDNRTECGNNIMGQRLRIRKCSNPYPRNGGADCQGKIVDEELVPCDNPPCGRKGGWSVWSKWSPLCNDSCGSVSMNISRTRTCDNPTRTSGGHDCIGEAQEFDSEQCFRNRPECPVDGGWGDWGQWSDMCSVTCGEAITQVQRTRNCSNPTPYYRGAECIGNSTQTETRRCERPFCFVHPGWAEWNHWAHPCRHACGVEYLLVNRTRVCVTKFLEYGFDCDGIGVQSRNNTCKFVNCPIDGGWTKWSNWLMNCAQYCANTRETATRYRACSQPKPQHKGALCKGNKLAINYQLCNTPSCIEFAVEHVPKVGSIIACIVLVIAFTVFAVKSYRIKKDRASQALIRESQRSRNQIRVRSNLFGTITEYRTTRDPRIPIPEYRFQSRP